MIESAPCRTFLFTDIEGSTRLWELSPAHMAEALSRHDLLLRRAVERSGGNVFKTLGDGICAVFDEAASAICAAFDGQCALLAERWPVDTPLTVRMALHTGAAERIGNDYFGSTLNRVARLLAIGHGKQILVSRATADAVAACLPSDVSLLDRGTHRLKDLQESEHVFQLCHAQLPAEFPALRSLSTHVNNLPQQLTSFVGRTGELAELKGLLNRHRFVTLTGAGGCGKTRLALQLAADLLESYPDGIWFVELASLADPGLLPQTVASALGVIERRPESYTKVIIDHLRARRAFLVLDNAEHLLGACASFVDDVLKSCPQVVALITSREPLSVTGEAIYRVPSLAVPDPKRHTDPQTLSQFESVQLFVARARMQRPDFDLTCENAPAVATICQRLDGIPFALELAAARLRSMFVDEVSRRLDERFHLLSVGARTALPRHKTLRSLIDWSYDLLSNAEQTLLCRMSVFAGGCTLDAVGKVCAGDVLNEDVIDIVYSLVDKNLLIAEQRAEATRYRQLETIRAYAQDRLLERGETSLYRQRHCCYFAALAAEAESRLTGASQKEWLDRLDTEHDNLRQALAWSSSRTTERLSGLRIATALSRFWSVRGYVGEGRRWLDLFMNDPAMREQAPETTARARDGAGRLARQQSDYSAAKMHYEESLALFRRCNDERGVADVLNNLGVMATDVGDHVTARALFEQSLGIRRRLGDAGLIATSINNLGLYAFERGDHSTARSLLSESLQILREVGDQRGVASALGNLGNVAREQGDLLASQQLFDQSLDMYRLLGDTLGIAWASAGLAEAARAQGRLAEARDLYKESLRLFHELGDRRLVAETLESVAHVTFALDAAQCAARLWGAAQRLREDIGAVAPDRDKVRYDEQVAAARKASSDSALFERNWREGREMNMDQAVRYALQD